MNIYEGKGQDEIHVVLFCSYTHGKFTKYETYTSCTGTGLVKRKFPRNFINIFLPITFSICFVCSKEPPH